MSKRVEGVRARLEAANVDAFIVTSAANRRYVSGFTGTSGVLVISRERALLLTDFRYVEQAREQAPAFEIIQCQTAVEGLTRGLGEAKSVAFESAHTSVEQKREWDEGLPGVEWVPVTGWVEALRAVKDEGELAAMERAIALTDRAFAYILDRIEGRTEREIAFDLEFFLRREGAEKLAFSTIVASGPNGALPHAVPSERKVGKGDLVTLDFGAVIDGYCSDMTRTVSVGPAGAREREIYELVLEAQVTGVRAVRPGRTGREVDAEARRVIEAAGYGEHFGHGLGHGVGSEVHEDPPRLSTRSESVLAPGMVTSVEPGVYIPGWGGVRIEDLVVVTQEGCRVLTNSPKELIEV